MKYEINNYYYYCKRLIGVSSDRSFEPKRAVEINSTKVKVK
jgi:hypothetical protein